MATITGPIEYFSKFIAFSNISFRERWSEGFQPQQSRGLLMNIFQKCILNVLWIEHR